MKVYDLPIGYYNWCIKYIIPKAQDVFPTFSTGVIQRNQPQKVP